MAFIWYLCIKYSILWISREVSRLFMSISSMAAGITISVVCLPSTASSWVLTLALVRRVFVTVFLPTAIITSMMRLSSSGPGYCDSIFYREECDVYYGQRRWVSVLEEVTWSEVCSLSEIRVLCTGNQELTVIARIPETVSFPSCAIGIAGKRICLRALYIFLAHPSISCRMTDVSIAVAHCVVQVSGERLLTAKGFCAVGVACRRKGSVSPSARVWPDGDMTACCHVMDWSVWRSCAVILSRPSPATHGTAAGGESAVQRSGRLLVQEAAVGDPLPSWSIINVWSYCNTIFHG